jgi:hypothetical protein
MNLSELAADILLAPYGKSHRDLNPQPPKLYYEICVEATCDDCGELTNCTEISQGFDPDTGEEEKVVLCTPCMENRYPNEPWN